MKSQLPFVWHHQSISIYVQSLKSEYQHRQTVLHVLQYLFPQAKLITVYIRSVRFFKELTAHKRRSLSLEELDDLNI